MADKSFEQQVMEQLADLRMKPDAGIWPEIEKELHKERKRRWLVWFFLLGALGAASFWGYNYFTAKQPVITHASAIIKSSTADPLQKENTTAVIKGEEKKINGQQDTHTNISSAGKTFTSVYKRLHGKEQKQQQELPQPQQQLSQITPVIDAVSKNDDKKITVAKEINNEIPPATIPDEKNNGKVISTSPVVDSPRTELKKSEPITQKITNTTDTAVTANSKPGKKTKNSWQWSIAGYAGSSGLAKSLLPQIHGGLYAAAPPSGPGSGVTTPVIVPTFKNGLAMGLQLEATKRIGKSSIGLSIGYSLLQTNTRVGKRVDSIFFSGGSGNTSISNNTGNNYYSSYYYNSADSINYTNRYHFIQLGADLYTPFRLFKKISLRWELGAGLNMLVSTNGLQYDESSNKFFSNNALFAKLQTYVSTGVDFAIGKEPFLYIGPHWQYSISNLSQQTGSAQHLYFSSLKVSVVLPKKKIKK